MTTYIVKSKKTEELYVCQSNSTRLSGDVTCTAIKDKYRYTIPSDDLEIILISDEAGIR